MILPCRHCGKIPVPKTDIKLFSQCTPDGTLIYTTNLECCGIKSFGGSIELGIEDWNDLQGMKIEVEIKKEIGQLSLF